MTSQGICRSRPRICISLSFSFLASPSAQAGSPVIRATISTTMLHVASCIATGTSTPHTTERSTAFPHTPTFHKTAQHHTLYTPPRGLNSLRSKRREGDAVCVSASVPCRVLRLSVEYQRAHLLHLRCLATKPNTHHEAFDAISG